MKRNEIKEKAISLFANKGYHDTSIQEIAEAAGINKATLYFYFKSKAELYAEIMQDTIPALCDAINNALEKVSKDDLEIKLKCIFTVLISELSFEEILLWKRTMLMCTNEYDQSVRKTAVTLFRERDMKIAQITRNIFLEKTSAKRRSATISNTAWR